MRGSPYTDLNRPPLNEAALRRALVGPGGLWTDIRVLPETGSTNADVTAAARGEAGPPVAEGLVVIAESQTAGRGRLDRTWEAPPRASLTLSMLLRPAVPVARLGWLPLLAGVALTEAVGRIAVVDAALKWPNDLLVRSSAAPGDYGKCAGILAEAVNGGDAPAVVVGIGLNVSQDAGELPPGRTALPATSLALVGAVSTDRDPLLKGLLRTFETWYGRWVDAGGDPTASGLAGAYLAACVTIGRDVAVSLPDGSSLEGAAEAVDGDGRLVIRTDRGSTAVAAGDVTHVR